MPPPLAPRPTSATSSAAGVDPVEALGGEPAETPEKRPTVEPSIVADVEEWWGKTDNLTQRSNALHEYREANKALFPARFNPKDPSGGQATAETRTGRDTRRVQTPVIYRGTLQITAMSVPEDLSFSWDAREQVKPPVTDPMLGQPAVAGDPALAGFGSTLQITQRTLLEEAKWIEKLQAWVQDSDTYPMAILKKTFRRDYQSTSLSPQVPDKDETDGTAAVQLLIEGYTKGEFDNTDARYAQMLQGLTSLRAKSRISRWYGNDIQLVPMESFGVLEDATDLVNIYDASAMFHDVLLTGKEILKRFAYREDEDGTTYGVLPEELSGATPWDADSTSTDTNSRSATRNKRRTAPNSSPLNARSTDKSGDPLKRKYLVREIWSKTDRTVYIVIRGLTHYVDRYVPQKRSEQWYPFYLLAPNRVPTELYGASSVELKRDIQARMHRKRSDEEKARWLHLPRGIYNKSLGVDEKEMIKLGEMKPGTLRGINLGGTNGMKIGDLVQWWNYEYNPESFNTMKDEQDLDLMGSLPVQAMGTTGSANFATEVNVAANGSAIATQFRKNNIKRAIDNFLMCDAEELLQELSAEEVSRIAGPFSVWPQVYDDVEAQQIVEDAQARAMDVAAQTVMLKVQQEVMTTGIVPQQEAILADIEKLSTPIWQTELMGIYGTPEPMSRESLFRRLKVGVTSSFNGRLDKQQNLTMLSLLADAVTSLAQGLAAIGVPFNPRSIILHHADLIGGTRVVDEAFPAISPMQIAEQIAKQALAMVAPPAAGAPGPNGPSSAAKPGAKPRGGSPRNQGPQGGKVNPVQQAENAGASAPNPAIG